MKQLGQSMLVGAGTGGFTFIEALLALGVVLLLLVIGLPLTQRFQAVSILDDEASALLTDLRRSQGAAIAGVGDTSHGVHLETTPSDTWTLFHGASHVPGDPGNEVHAIPGAVEMISVSLLGGGTDVIFTERRGTTGQAGTIVLRALNGEIRTVSIAGSGTLQAQ